jgi:hypothetical protein
MVPQMIIIGQVIAIMIIIIVKDRIICLTDFVWLRPKMSDLSDGVVQNSALLGFLYYFFKNVRLF